MSIVTAESLTTLLAREDLRTKVIGRALVVVFNNQTSTEKSLNDTNQDNGIGFTKADARSGCISAKVFLRTGTLQDWVVEKWMKPARNGTPRIVKYWRQLDVAAKEKAGC